MASEPRFVWDISAVTPPLSCKAEELAKAIKTACNLGTEDESDLSNFSHYLVATKAMRPPAHARQSVHDLAVFLEKWESLEPAELWHFYYKNVSVRLIHIWGEAFKKAQIPLAHAPLNRQSAITYAIYASDAHLIALDIAIAQNDTTSHTLAQQTGQDAYYAAGLAWRAKNSDDTAEIAFCMEGAECFKDEAIARAAQVLEGALDVDPAMVERYTGHYQLLLNREATFKDLRSQSIHLMEIFDRQGVSEAERVASQLPNTRTIEGEWNKFREWHPNAFLVSDFIAKSNPELCIDTEGKAISPEDLAATLAVQLTAARLSGFPYNPL